MRQLFSLHLGLLTAFVWLIAACVATRPQADYAAVLSNPARPENERALDPERKPHDVMAFYGVKKGDKVADI